MKLTSIWIAALIVFLGAASSFAQTPASNLQMQLAADSAFVQRVEYLLVQQAHVVKLEGASPSACSGVTLPPGNATTATCHSVRAAFAGGVLASPLTWATQVAVSLVGQVNLLSGVVTTCTTAVAATLTNAAVPSVCTTNTTDAAILSQIATIWNALAGAL